VPTGEVARGAEREVTVTLVDDRFGPVAHGDPHRDDGDVGERGLRLTQPRLTDMTETIDT
jgi:hypothetical protein